MKKLIFVEGELTGKEDDLFKPQLIDAENVKSIYVQDNLNDLKDRGVIIETKSRDKYVFCWDQGDGYADEILSRLSAALINQESNEIIGATYPECNQIKTRNGTVLHYLYNKLPGYEGGEGPTNKAIAEVRENIRRSYEEQSRHYNAVKNSIANLKTLMKLEIKPPAIGRTVQLYGYPKEDGWGFGVRADKKLEYMDDEVEKIQNAVQEYGRAVHLYNFYQAVYARYTGERMDYPPADENAELLSLDDKKLIEKEQAISLAEFERREQEEQARNTKA